MMYEIFMTYWIIGIIFMFVFQLISIIQKKSLGDNYIHSDTQVPIMVAVFMNILLTVTYPIMIIILMISTLSYAQERKRVAKSLEDVVKSFEELKEKAKRKEKQDENI